MFPILFHCLSPAILNRKVMSKVRSDTSLSFTKDFPRYSPVVVCDSVRFRVRPRERPIAIAAKIRPMLNAMARPIARVLLRTKLNISSVEKLKSVARTN